MTKYLTLLLICFSLTGCVATSRPELLTSIRNGNQTTYIYYEKGHYVAYYMKDGVLIKREVISK